MYKMLKFEINRGRRFLLYYLVGLTVGYVLLNLIDPDHEKIVVMLSVTLILLPVIGVLTISVYHLYSDTNKMTKYFYLALPYEPGIFITSKLMHSVFQYVVYMLLLANYHDAHIINKYVIFIGLGLVAISFIVQWVWTSSMIRKGFKK